MARLNGGIDHQEGVPASTLLSLPASRHIVGAFIKQYNHHRRIQPLATLHGGTVKLQHREEEIFTERQQKLALARQQRQQYRQEKEASQL